MKKLQELNDRLNAVEKLTDLQLKLLSGKPKASHAPVASLLLRLKGKISDTLASLDQISEAIDEIYCAGVVDGFSREPETYFGLEPQACLQSPHVVALLRSEEHLKEKFHIAQMRLF